MREVSERPVYSMINPVDQVGQERENYIFFSNPPDMMPLRLACSDVVAQDGHVKVLNIEGKVVARVSELVPWQFVRRGVLLEERYEDFVVRQFGEEKIVDKIRDEKELAVYGKEEYDKRHKPRYMVMGPHGPMEYESPEEPPKEAAASGSTHLGQYL